MYSGSIAAQHRDAFRVRIDHRRGDAETLLRTGSDRSLGRLDRKGGGNAMRHQGLTAGAFRGTERQARGRH